MLRGLRLWMVAVTAVRMLRAVRIFHIPLVLRVSQLLHILKARAVDSEGLRRGVRNLVLGTLPLVMAREQPEIRVVGVCAKCKWSLAGGGGAERN